jgi:CDP-glucose 4,6-dehydratase
MGKWPSTLESMDLNPLYNNIYLGTRVLVTGHTGFKGSWLCLWLVQMGAKVIGFSLPPSSQPNHFEMLDIDMQSVYGDIRDIDALKKVIKENRPEIVFHLAAQALVRDSYKCPIDTYDTNVMGTLKVFEACRLSESVTAIVNITSDKCYENREWDWAYRENDPMGGYDPYSSSKGCAELLTASYRNSYFNIDSYKTSHNILLASARAGNVIGGGDWAKDRLIPDIMKASAKNECVEIRSPNSTRPWQHVLEPLSGYLILGQRLLEGEVKVAQGWNFGPSDEAILSVGKVAEMVNKKWGACSFQINTSLNHLHEAKLLKLDSTMAKTHLGWRNIWSSEDSIKFTVEWYRDYHCDSIIRTVEHLKEYTNRLIT